MNSKRVRLWGLVFVAPVLLLLAVSGNFVYLKGSEYSDLAISHLPNMLWIQRSLREWGQIPLWSNLILSGTPFNADPLSGLHYPPGWAAVLFPQPLGLNLVMALHLVLGGVGMYRFLRQEGLEQAPALFGALAFEAMPKLAAHLGAGHVSLIYAVSWTPWLLWAERRAKGRLWLPAGALGMIALADPRWAALAGCLWLAYRLYTAYRRNDDAFTLKELWRWGRESSASGLLAVLLAAILLFPLAQYTALSTRSALRAEDVLAYSLPPLQLLGLFTPPLGGTPEYSLYLGALPLAAAVLGLWRPAVRRQAGFWYITAAVTLILAMGSYLPGASLAAKLPGFSLLRVPTRGLFAGGLALAAAAAWSLQDLLAHPNGIKQSRRFNPFLIFTTIALLLFALSGLGWWATKEFPLRFAWGAGAWAGGLSILFLYRAEKLSPRLFAIVCVLWLGLDLCLSNGLGWVSRPAAEIYGQGKAVVSALPAGLAPYNMFRLYSPSYSLPQQTAAAHGLELADGIDPLQLEKYVEFMRSAGGVAAEGYSVTLPAFENGEPRTDNANAKPDARLLGLLNVAVVTAEFPLEVDGLEEIGRAGSTILYRNQWVYPRAWVQEEGWKVDGAYRLAEDISWTPNRITVTASGPGKLILSELAFPGWSARLDGEKIPLQTAILFRAVDLPAGRHTVSFTYKPFWFFAGALVSGLSWGFWLVLWRRANGKRK